MASTAAPVCPSCEGQRDECEVCGGRALQPLLGSAALRGSRWAERVVRTLVSRWPIGWPRSPRAFLIASRLVEDLARKEGQRERLARVCIQAAALRYGELLDYLRGVRLNLPPAGTDDGDTPE